MNCSGPRIPTNVKNCLGYFMPCPNKRKGHDHNSPGLPERTRRILQQWSLSNQMNTPIRIKNFLLLQRFANQHHRNPQKTEFILLRQSTSSLKSASPIEDLNDDVDWRSKMNSVFLGFMEQYYWFIFVISVVNTFCGV